MVVKNYLGRDSLLSLFRVGGSTGGKERETVIRESER
jgi:hypothetical protein